MNRDDVFGIGLIVAILLVTYHLAGKDSDESGIQRLVHLVRPPVPKTVTYDGKIYRFTKRIKIIKDTSRQTSPPGARPDWRSIHVSIISVYGDHRVRVPASGFSSVKLSSTLDSNHVASNALDLDLNTSAATSPNDTIATLTLTLRDEMWIESIDLVSSDEYLESLIGGRIITEDADGKQIWMAEITHSRDSSFRPGNPNLR